MNPGQINSAPSPASVTLIDVYYTLFRHKWLTAALVALGVASGGAVYRLWPFPYTSEAKLYIRYVQETTAPAAMDGNGNFSIRSPDDRGANILNTELEMLESLDPAKAVAHEIGPDKILGRPLASTVLTAYEAVAGNYILANLKAEVPPKTDMIVLHYNARDPRLAQQVLTALIMAYQSNYVAMHLSRGVSDEFLQDQTAESKNHLDVTMKTLEEEKQKLGITSLADSKKNVTDMLFKTQASIYQALAEMAENAAIITNLQARAAAMMPKVSGTNILTNLAAALSAAHPAPDLAAKYQSLNAVLAASRAEEQKWLIQLTPSNKLVQNAQMQRAAAEAAVEKFEAENPGLVAIQTSVTGSSASPVTPLAHPMSALQAAWSKQDGLSATYRELTNQLAQIEAQARQLNIAEDDIAKAETEKEVAEAKYKHFLTSQEQARIDLATGNKAPNIKTAELPTPGARDRKKIAKMTGEVLGFFFALALGLPFLIELVLDQSLRHPMDVKARIGAPFIITLPRTNGHFKLASLKGDQPVALWHELRPVFDAMRDRLMTYFEMINLTHKPKLVAVTSCGRGAGVTTTAAGLASSLSETGEGNVLLVNMTVQDGEAHHYSKSKRDCGLEEVLGMEKRDQARVQDHLYFVKGTGSGESLPCVLPKRFSHLVPLMKASDYDYIIFDMPPISEISTTSRLARFMDMVLVVIESGKTSRVAGMRAASLLAESQTNVGLVLNKNRSYLPKRLQNV